MAEKEIKVDAQGRCLAHGLPGRECARCNRNDIVISEDGGVQSKLDERPSLIPPRAAMLISRILGIKARQYGAWNWKKINNEDNFDHVLAHAFRHIEGDRSEFHPANLTCRALFYLEGLLEKGHDYDLYYLGVPKGLLGQVPVVGGTDARGGDVKHPVPVVHEICTPECPCRDRE